MAAADPSLTYVFDACAVIALLQKESGAEQVASLLEGEGHRCLVHSIQVCEIFYDRLRRGLGGGSESLESMLMAVGFEIVTDTRDLWPTAGRLKAELRRVSLADCFAMALTLREGGSLVSTDHHELDPVQAAGLCPIHFVR
ncbi:MAG TPA: PIN domain-containing protein [Thermoanaerobaculia bacterium]|nr:PIN domain-containing protein [Thermoanaerobaculia bacterium]